jgi:excisionase family DNA binding protein
MTVKQVGLLDTHLVAQMLGCTPKHVRDLIRGKIKGKVLRAYVVGKRTYRVRREDVHQYLADCQVDEEKFYE